MLKPSYLKKYRIQILLHAYYEQIKVMPFSEIDCSNVK